MKLNWLRYPPSLRISIPLLALVFNLCFLCLTAYLLHLREQDREVARAINITKNIAISLTSHDLFNPTRESLSFQSKIDFIYKDTLIQWVAICNSTGTIAYSTHPNQIGQSIQSVAPIKVAEAVNHTLNDNVANLFEQNLRSTIAILPSPSNKNGLEIYAVIVERDLTKALDRVRANSLSDTLLAAIVL